jgi:hypothetical protein
MLYEHTDIPEGMTCAEFKRSRPPARRRRLLRLPVRRRSVVAAA